MHAHDLKCFFLLYFEFSLGRISLLTDFLESFAEESRLKFGCYHAFYHNFFLSKLVFPFLGKEEVELRNPA